MTAASEPPPASALEPAADAALETDIRLHQARVSLLDMVRDRDMRDLTLRELAMLLVAVEGATSLTVRRLAAYLMVPKPAISRALDALHQDELLRRIDDPDDGRSVLVEVTDLGRDLAQRAAEAASTIRTAADVAILRTPQLLVDLPLSREACIAARQALGWSVEQLAAAGGLSSFTIHRLENGGGRMRYDTLAAIRAALEAAGVEFIEENGGGPGVRLRPSPSSRTGRSGKQMHGTLPTQYKRPRS